MDIQASELRESIPKDLNVNKYIFIAPLLLFASIFYFLSTKDDAPPLLTQEDILNANKVNKKVASLVRDNYKKYLKLKNFPKNSDLFKKAEKHKALALNIIYKSTTKKPLLELALKREISKLEKENGEK